MLDSILEFITQAASSSAFIFCFCNLIIVIILVDMKPSLSIHQESEILLSMDTNPTKKQETEPKHIVQEAQVSQVQEPKEAELDEEAKTLAAKNIEMKGNDDWSNEEEEREEVEEDDELKRRVEEFIEKVNRGWKQELLSTSL
ncbi:hypothetical protein Lal_00034825 [Lupinus albus]|uniref:Uncharacterized protein n=1 Tax=Lupinus albus TaxID=3870 RepID=A0A6A5PIF3_LUPAL|nr:hypothetical protein Lalb_Chr03g0033111 [Lupinus albus]KAF1897123.1 hypothetical protein Lal_00034825 [Lupinus albus]